MGFGDDMLRFNGIGERITVAMNNNDAPTQADKDAYYAIALWAADRGMSLTMHWGNDASVDHLLTIFERVNREIPIAPLRWSIAHLNDASERDAATDEGARRRLDDAGCDVFRRRAVPAASRGRESARRTPPVETARKHRRRRRRRHRRASRGVLQPVHRAAVASRREDRRRRRRCAGPRRRRVAPTRCASTRSAARGSPSMKRGAARSRWASSPTSRCSLRTT